MGSCASALCQYFLNESSKFPINRLASIAVFEREAATLRPCVRSEPKIADGSDLASSMAFASDPRFPTWRDEDTLPISIRARMFDFWIDLVSPDGRELDSQIICQVRPKYIGHFRQVLEGLTRQSPKHIFHHNNKTK